MKKSFIIVFLFCLLCCCSCNKKNNQKEDQTIEIPLTLENYEYYLTITSIYNNTVTAQQGNYRCSTYDVFIDGAVDGLYVDCVLYLENGKNIKLNAAGYAQTAKSISNGEDSFKVVKVEGKIIIN